MSKSKRYRVTEAKEDENVILRLCGPRWNPGYVQTAFTEYVYPIEIPGVGQKLHGGIVCFEMKEMPQVYIVGSTTAFSNDAYMWMNAKTKTVGWTGTTQSVDAWRYAYLDESSFWLYLTARNLGGCVSAALIPEPQTTSISNYYKRIYSPQCGLHILRRVTHTITTEACKMFFGVCGRYVTVDPVMYATHQLAESQTDQSLANPPLPHGMADRPPADDGDDNDDDATSDASFMSSGSKPTLLDSDCMAHIVFQGLSGPA